MTRPDLPPPFTDADRFLAALVDRMDELIDKANDDAVCARLDRVCDRLDAILDVLPRPADASDPGGGDGTVPLVEPARPAEGSSAEDASGQGLVSLGGPWWQLPNGEKVRGKEAAEQALRELREDG